jgi:hypothetical protein
MARLEAPAADANIGKENRTGVLKMFWTKIHGEELQRLQNRIELPTQSSIREASALRTPFYDNGELVRINDGMGTIFLVAAGPGELSTRTYYPLNGNAGDIRAANEAAALFITQESAIDYLRFFMTFLRTGDGESFAIIESLNGFGLVNEDKPDQRKPEDMRLTYEGANADGDAFTYRGYVVYQRELFAVLMLVRNDGTVEMLDDDRMGFIVRLN